MQISQDTIHFLTDLGKNNDRDWFTANKKRYETAHLEVASFCEGMIEKLSSIDQIELVSGKKSLMRIYRDVRFSKDKSPYRNRFCGYFKRATEQRRGTYVFNIEPGKFFVGGGFWGPAPKDLLKIRNGIKNNLDEFKSIVEAPHFIETFGAIHGESLKTAPKGFEKDDPAIEYLRLKQFLVGRDLTEADILNPNFPMMCLEIYNKLRPFFDFMSRELTQ